MTKRIDLQGQTRGSDYLIAPTNKHIGKNLLWLVKCHNCNTVREAIIANNSKMYPRCQCKIKYKVGRIINGRELLERISRDQWRVRCVNCGRIYYIDTSSIKNSKGRCKRCCEHPQAIKHLTRNKAIAIMRREGFTYESIGKIFGGISRQRIEQIVKNTIIEENSHEPTQS